MEYIVFGATVVSLAVIHLWACQKIASGKAPNYKEGLKQVFGELWKALGGKTPPQAPRIEEIPKEYFTDLTESLSPHFNWLNYKHGEYGANYLFIVYHFQQRNVGIDIIEQIFESFIRDFFNLHASTSVSVFAQTRGEFLILRYALSDKSCKQIENAKKRRESRLIPSNDGDLVE